MSRTACLLSTVLFLGIPAVDSAAWPTVPSEELTVHEDSFIQKVVSDGNGGAYFAMGTLDGIRLIRVDASGIAPGWPSDGILVDGLATYDFSLAPDASGGVYIAWAYPTQAYVQRFTSQGTVAPNWPAGGWNFSSGAGMTIHRDIDDCLYVLFHKNSSLYATRLQGNATPAPGWFAGGRAVGTPGVKTALVPDGLGGSYLAYYLNLAEGTKVRVDHRNSTGSLFRQWTSDVFPAYNPPGILHAIPDGEGGVIVGWAYRLGQWVYESSYTRMSATQMPAEGWPAGGGFHSVPDAWLHRLVLDGSGGFYAQWFLGDDALATRRLLNGSTASGWTAEGTLLPDAYGASGVIYHAFDAAADGNGGLLYAWLSTQVNVGRFEADGSIDSQWPQVGPVVQSDVAGRVYLDLVEDGHGGAIASWLRPVAPGSGNTDGPCEAQHLNADGTLGPPANVSTSPLRGPETVALAPPRPNPAHRTVSLTLDLPDAGRVSASVLDLQGRHVRSLADDLRSAGVHRFEWDLQDRQGRRVQPGLYLIRVTTPAGVQIRRVAVID